jgi:hypothetical protein
MRHQPPATTQLPLRGVTTTRIPRRLASLGGGVGTPDGLSWARKNKQKKRLHGSAKGAKKNKTESRNESEAQTLAMPTSCVVNDRVAVRVLGSTSLRADAEDHRRASSNIGGRGGQGGPGGRRPA